MEDKILEDKVTIINDEIKNKLLQSYNNYRKTMQYLAADIPISALCLPKSIETILENSGFLRVYDLIDADLTKIKGLGTIRREILASSLDKFFPIG